MPSFDNDEIFGPKSHFLSAAATLPRKSPSKQSIGRRSTAPLRVSQNLSHSMEDDTSNGRHSLAHELAVALMPEPTAGSKLLAEEFGIEYDEGAEGIDEPSQLQNGAQLVVPDGPSFADELNGDGMLTPTMSSSFHDAVGREKGGRDALELEQDGSGIPLDIDPVFGSPFKRKPTKPKRPEQQDPMVMLAQDLEFTDKFLGHLRRIDTDPSSSYSQQPALERMASDVIRKINQTARDREGQLRELLECEREFRKIAGEVGGTDVLGQLDELKDLEDDSVDSKSASGAPPRTEARALTIVEEEDEGLASHNTSINDWELDPDHNHLGDDDYDQPEPSPRKDAFLPPPPIDGPITPAKTIPQLAHLRTFTSSLVSSLGTISEQAQVNGAATTEAGRKIRALKNKLGGLRTDWDSAERSRVRIDRWEAGIVDGDPIEGSPGSPVGRVNSRRVDGRILVEEHLRAFELAIADASVKTKAIMAS
ncbi:hypothetical protein AX16_001430 [Volvariella volvacea WC 439]|nr:hypothetical protein AX16_001430 [Volvariella volvacea WC 439]